MRKRKKRNTNSSAGMKTLRELYRIGTGPSSSHTMGPESAAKLFMKRNPSADSFKVVLFGSLAMTGEGHNTVKMLKNTLNKPTEILADKLTKNIPHPNTLDFYAYTDGLQTAYMRVASVGGGAIVIEGETTEESPNIYDLSTFEDIAKYCSDQGIRLYDYVSQCEDADIDLYMAHVWDTMKASIERGLKATGILPGGLGVRRKAKYLFERNDDTVLHECSMAAYAFAVAEENASGGVICTAPTCGACGVLPAVLYSMQQKFGYSDLRIINALKTAGIIGNLIKTNASISGAECGCQAEIGSATSMAAAALGELFDYSIEQIEYAAEIAMEHQLGLTCDPVGGLVQIPCIERNAVAAARALTSVTLAKYLSDSRLVSFDDVVETLLRTGKDMNCNYRETSRGGLAKTLKTYTGKLR